MPHARVLPIALLLAVVVSSGASAQEVEHGPSFGVYCHPGNFASDPVDVPAEGSKKGPLPAGLVEREIAIDGVKTFVIEGGDRSKPAFVLVPGNPGSARDFVPQLAAIAQHAHAISYDLPGWGHADKPRDFPYTLDGQTKYLEKLLDALGVRKAIMGGHDLGATFALEWLVRHPDRALGAFTSGGGLAVGYEWHQNARIWRTPEQGEMFWTVLNRQLWTWGINSYQPKPLPPEFVNRMYDDLDRMTRCAILDTYRRAKAPDATSRRLAAALAPLDLPAVVIWGRHDAFIGPEYAERAKLGFPRAEIHIFEDGGHWMFADDPGRTASVLARFASRVLAPRAALRVAPAGWRAGRRRVRVRVAASPVAHDVAVEVRRGRRLLARSTLPALAGRRVLSMRLRDPLRPGRHRIRVVATNADAVVRSVTVFAERRAARRGRRGSPRG